MIVASYTTVRPTMSETHTYEDFFKFIGTKPHMLGIVSRMNKDLTADFLTRSLANIYYNDEKSANKFQSIDAMYWEYEIETNFIKRIPYALAPVGDGADGTEITFYFTERYYEKYDIFKDDQTRQQFIVVSRPIRKSDNCWEV